MRNKFKIQNVIQRHQPKDLLRFFSSIWRIGMISARGFTVIELIVVISIISFLSLTGIASYVSFSNSQEIQVAGQDFVTILQLAKSRTSSQVRPNSCIVDGKALDGYRLEIAPPNIYKLSAVCGGDKYNEQSFLLPKNISFDEIDALMPTTTTTNVIFPVITLRPQGAGTIVLSGHGKKIGIIVDAAGTIKTQSPYIPVDPTPTITLTPAPTNTPTPIPGLIAWWEFEGNATDSINGYDGTANGASLTADSNAYSFVSSESDYISFITSVFPTGGEALSDFSISLWVNPTTIGDNNEILVIQAPAAERAGDIALWVRSTNTLVFDRWDGTDNSGDRGETSTGALTAGQWQHIVATWSGGDNGARTIYVNGVSQFLTTNANNVNTGGWNINTTLIGGNYAGYFYNGVIDDVRIYNRALSAEEIGILSSQ